MVRYYRYVIDSINTSEFTSIKLSFRVGNGIIIYVQGQEIYRNNLPSSGEITPTTPATGVLESNPSTRFLYIPRSLISSSGPTVIAIESHLPANITGGADFFTVGGHRFATSETSYSSPLLYYSSATIVAQPESTVENMKSRSLFDCNIETYYSPLATTATVVYMDNNKNAI